MKNMRIECNNDEWWIFGKCDVKEWDSEGFIGPYDTKTEAKKALRRLCDFERYENEPGYVSSETKGNK